MCLSKNEAPVTRTDKNEAPVTRTDKNEAPVTRTDKNEAPEACLQKDQMIAAIEKGGCLPQTIGFWIDPLAYSGSSGDGSGGSDVDSNDNGSGGGGRNVSGGYGGGSDRNGSGDDSGGGSNRNGSGDDSGGGGRNGSGDDSGGGSDRNGGRNGAINGSRNASGEVRALLERYPSDALMLIPAFPGYAESPFADHPSYVWGGKYQAASSAIDSQRIITDWDGLDAFIKNMPRASLAPITESAARMAREDATGRYRLCYFWLFLYERLWSFRGMENALVDLHFNKGEVIKLFHALCEFYLGCVDRINDEIGCDGVFITDDLGTQQSLMFSPETFREVFLPFYRMFVDACHKRGLHLWLHSCGNISSILPDLIGIGIDVLHPIQKYAMDEAGTAAKYRGQICFMCGMDVQQAMPFGTPDDVRAEAARLVDTFSGGGGRMIFSMGNAVTPNIPIENIRALYEEVYRLRKCN